MFPVKQKPLLPSSVFSYALLFPDLPTIPASLRLKFPSGNRLTKKLLITAISVTTSHVMPPPGRSIRSTFHLRNRSRRPAPITIDDAALQDTLPHAIVHNHSFRSNTGLPVRNHGGDERRPYPNLEDRDNNLTAAAGSRFRRLIRYSGQYRFPPKTGLPRSFTNPARPESVSQSSPLPP